MTHKAKTETLPPKALKSEFRIKPAAAEPKHGMKILVGVIILAVAAAGAAFLFRNRSNGSAALQQTPQEFRVEGSSFEKRIYPGDRLLIQTGSDVISVTLRAIEDTAVFETPQGAMQVSLGGNVTFDLNTDNYPEAVLTASDFEKGKTEKWCSGQGRTAGSANGGQYRRNHDSGWHGGSPAKPTACQFDHFQIAARPLPVHGNHQFPRQLHAQI